MTGRLCAALVATLLAAPSVAVAANCHSVPLDETPAAFLRALAPRAAEIGIVDIDFLKRKDGLSQYILLGAESSLFLLERAGVLTEVDIIHSDAEGPAERSRQIVIIAFALSRFSGDPEIAVRNAVRDAVDAHPGNGNWTVERSGKVVAAFVQSADGFVAKIGRMRCE